MHGSPETSLSLGTVTIPWSVPHGECLTRRKTCSVPINLQCAHYVMLTRPLVYTAITRGKENVIIVGERRALCMAIKKTDTEKRGTCLAKRLRAAMQ